MLVKTVLTARPIYALMALDPSLWVIKEIDKRRRAFLWKGTETVAGGHFFVACPSVCRPTKCGGLGLHNLCVLGHALCIRWLWLQRTSTSRPWQGLAIQASSIERNMFQNSLVVWLGNGERALFWFEWWLNERSIPVIAPALVRTVSLAIPNTRTVA